jgi:hypothetical protein
MRRLMLIPLLVATPAFAGERSFMLTEFDRIRVEGPFDVRVVAEGRAGARAVGDDDALERVELRVQGTTLVVTAAAGGWGGTSPRGGPVVITLVGRAVRGAVVNGGGKLSVVRMRGQRVDLALNGSGMLSVAAIEADEIVTNLLGTGVITVAGTTARARFVSNGAGSIDAEGLQAADLKVVSSGTGDSRYTARYTADVSAIGLGTVQVAGAATCVTRGTGPVSCAGRMKRAGQ